MKRDDDHYGARRPAPPVEDLPLFGGPPPVEPETPPPATVRRVKARAVHNAGARRWIDAGKPIALLVAAQEGQVTAETFRAAADKLPHALPPSYGDQRALSWIPTMFAELCREGRLQKQRHPNGAPVKVYSKEQGNDQVVYEPCATAVHGRSA